MSEPKDDGGPAFPQIKSTITAFSNEGLPIGSGITGFNCGISMRDYFAAKAMPQLIAHMGVTELTAKYCYDIADLMLKARKQ